MFTRHVRQSLSLPRIRCHSLARGRRALLTALLASAVGSAVSGPITGQSHVIGWGGEEFDSRLQAMEVDGGGGYTLARLSDGSVVAWGSNDWGQCDVPAPQPGQTYAGLAAGVNFSVARVEVSATTCTAGIAASGCKAVLSTTGIPSATSPSGFHLIASNVEGAKAGIFFYGTHGRRATPWGDGTSFWCVIPPVTRAGLMAGAGLPGLCDGHFDKDLNTLWFTFPSKNPGAGATVQTQLWYRDPQSTSNHTTSFSDAIEFVVGP